jgi:hypothetical protein
MKHLISLSIVFTTMALPAWADTQIPEPSSIGGIVLGVGAAWLILRSRGKK